MYILLDTSTPLAYLKLIKGDGTEQELTWQADRQLAKGLLAWLHSSLTEQGLDWYDIKGIGVRKGPGSFTGLRIGVAVCNTLADSLGVPIVGTSGDVWQNDAMDRLYLQDTDSVVLPDYGREARITTPRK